jgi:membrane protease subunit HflK
MKAVKSEFSSEFRMMKTVMRRLTVWFVILGALAYLLSGIYVVGVNETGVVKRFGRLIDDRAAPGLHYRLPWPIDSVIRVSTREIRRFQTGFGAEPEQVADFERSFGNIDASPTGSFVVPYCITGDKNIIHVKVIAQYRIEDPRAYLVGFKDGEGVALRCIQSAILNTFCQSDVDAALTAGRVILQQQILSSVQRQLADLNTGISVISAEIKNTRPPSSVALAFKDVINAREERRTMVHDANAYRNQMIPQGKAEASRIVNEAEAYKAKKIAHAQGEAERFVMLAKKYQENREITCQRLYLDAITEIMPAVEKIIVGSDHGRNIANLRLFTQGNNEGNK